jgi:hypothetical protein
VILLATIVEYVKGYMDVKIDEGILCAGCGTGNTVDAEPRPCRCGMMMQSHTFDFSKWKPGYVVIRCVCGTKLDCMSFTNTCSCGRDYNFAGTDLGPRELWGEETGETWMECY